MQQKINSKSGAVEMKLTEAEKRQLRQAKLLVDLIGQVSIDKTIKPAAEAASEGLKTLVLKFSGVKEEEADA